MCASMRNEVGRLCESSLTGLTDMRLARRRRRTSSLADLMVTYSGTRTTSALATVVRLVAAIRRVRAQRFFAHRVAADDAVVK